MAKTTKPSAALLIALVALVVALCGTAMSASVAVPAAARALTKSKVKQIAAKEADKEIAKKAATLSVATAGDAGKVDGLDANQLVRVASASNDTRVDNFSSQTYVTVVSKSVPAPVTGLLSTNGTVEIARDGSNTAGQSCSYHVRVTIDGAPASPETSGSDYDTSSGFGTSAPVSGVAPVTAGSHIVALQLRRDFFGGNCYLYGGQFSTLFVPFGAGGVQGQARPAPDSSASPARPQP